MQNCYEYENRQIIRFNYWGDQIDHLNPIKLEEEEEVDYDEFEELKKKQKKIKEDLLDKQNIIDVDKKKKDTSH